jgi:rod shape-determining protein MreD
MARPSTIVLICCVILWLCVTQLNHYLAPLHTSVFAGGLLVTFSALRMTFRESWWISLVMGCLIDATTPVPFGFHGILFVAAHVGIFSLRSGFPREEAAFSAVVALAANLALFIAVSLALLRRSPEPLTTAGRLFVDLLASEGAVLLAAPWFFAFQERALELAGISLRREQRGLH